MKVTDEMVEKACAAYWSKHLEEQLQRDTEPLLPSWDEMPIQIKRVSLVNMRAALEAVIGDKTCS